jgi:hypothetical protein
MAGFSPDDRGYGGALRAPGENRFSFFTAAAIGKKAKKQYVFKVLSGIINYTG